MGDTIAYQPRKQRSRRGCLTCRKRKVKCDEGEGVCQNCTRLKVECVWRRTEQTQRSRINRACYNCRQKKVRCRTERSSAACTPCRQAGLVCSENPVVQNTDQRLELLELVEAFFQGPHKFFFFTFLHQPSFIQMLESDLIPRHLLLAMTATVQRIRDPKGPADAWADESRHLVMQEIFDRLSTASLQTLLLLQRYEENRGSHLTAWLLSGLVIRIAHALQLNIEHDDQPATIREVRRRIMWSCFVMDSLMESGARPVSGLRLSDITIGLPGSEADFYKGTVNPGACVDHSDTTAALFAARESIGAQLVSLAILRVQIVNYTFSYHRRNINNLPHELPWAAGAQFRHLQQNLERWRRQLPSRFRLDTHNRPPSSELTQLLSLHCLFHGAYCDLLRIGALLSSLPATSFPRPPSAFLDDCAWRLLDHALEIANGITMASKNSSIYCDSYAAICGCLALRLLIVDRRPQDRTLRVPLSDTNIQDAIEGTFRYATGVAKWSEPIRRYLSAVSEMCSKRRYPLGAGDSGISIPSVTITSAGVSRAPSPSLRTYGTFGAVRREIVADETQSITTPSVTVEQPSFENSVTENGLNTHAMTDMTETIDRNGLLPDGPGAFLYPTDPLSEEALQMFTEWADGTYDAASTEALWGYNMFSPDFGSAEYLFNSGL